MEFNTNDPKNIIGVSTLVNSSGTEQNKELFDLEREIINGISLEDEEENNTKRYKKEIEHLANAYNIDNFQLTDEAPTSISYNRNAYGDNNGEYNVNGGTNVNSGYNNIGSNNVGSNNTGSSSVPNDFMHTNSHQNDGISGIKSGKLSFLDDEVADEQLKYMTLEQKRQNYVDSVLGDIKKDKELEFDLDREKEEDEKNSLLEQIDTLRTILEDDGVDLSNIPIVTKKSTMSDINNVYKILRLKNDRNRYCTFAEEMILAGAQGLEYLFDGKNDWFGRRPDLTGWSNTCKLKLRRCRFQTSTLVKDIMRDYSMSPWVQLTLELIPSAFLYSRQRNLMNAGNSDDMKYKEAISNLNEQML